MVNLLEVNFKDNGELDVQLNIELLELFISQEDMFSYINHEDFAKAIFPLANEVIKRAERYKNL